MLNVAVGLRRFVVEQGFVGADDMAAVWVAQQFLRTVFAGQARFAGAALPFASGTVGEAGKITRIPSGRADEVAGAAARSGDDDEAGIRCCRTFAVQPAVHAVQVRVHELVVRGVADGVQRGAEVLRKTGSDEAAVCFGVSNGSVVRGEISGGIRTCSGKWRVAVLLDVRAQDSAAIAA